MVTFDVALVKRELIALNRLDQLRFSSEPKIWAPNEDRSQGIAAFRDSLPSGLLDATQGPESGVVVPLFDAGTDSTLFVDEPWIPAIVWNDLWGNVMIVVLRLCRVLVPTTSKSLSMKLLPWKVAQLVRRREEFRSIELFQTG
jgi:hypothetical protein